MINEKEAITKALVTVAERMALAARTAPKAKGIGNISILIFERDDIKNLSVHMLSMGEKHDLPVLRRDSQDILHSPVMLLIGTKIQPVGLKYCGLCGLGNCENKAKYPDVPCSFNTGDLGIAIGSAVSIAADSRVDNRIMYSAGIAALEMGLLGPDVKVAYGIPLSASDKNPFFDRK